jgi:hypothetical protein
MKNKAAVKATAIVCAAALIIPILYANAEYKEDDIKTVVNEAIEWKEGNDNPFYSIGTYSSDLYVTALSRLGKNYDYSAYLSGLDSAAAGYGSESNVADMQRTVLAAMASGGEAGNLGGRDMLADSTYYRNASAPIDRDGIDGFAWALVALDTYEYEVPDWALTNRNDMISSLLAHQNTDGGFDDSVYQTSAAIIALAPYYETSGAYTITQTQTGYVLDLSPKDAVDKAVEYLSGKQTNYGDFGDLKSTAVTIMALDAIGINPNSDRRFEAKKGNAIDGLLLYRRSDGGFASDLKGSDGEGTSLALCALTSYLRFAQGKPDFFRFNNYDYVVLDINSSSNSGNDNNSSVSSGTAPSAASSSSASSSKTTTKTGTTSKTKSTIAPAKSTTPAKTMQPTKTASPAQSPSATAKAKATKKPALVGPAEMPGPIQEGEDNTSSSINSSSDTHKTSAGTIAAGIVICLLLLAAAAAVAVLYFARVNKLSGNIPLAKFIPFFKEEKKDKEYRAKKHRKTEQRRRFDEHEKFKKRRRFEERRKY